MRLANARVAKQDDFEHEVVVVVVTGIHVFRFLIQF
jgi:hypothetical protein